MSAVNANPTAQTEDATPAKSGGGAAKIAIFVVAIIGLTAAFKFLPVGEYLGAFLEWIQGLGIWGPVLLGAAYVVATVFMVPGTILTLGAGFAFGPIIGTIAVSLGSTLGAGAAFLVGRLFARDFVNGLMEKFPKFAAVNGAVEQSGFKIVALTRLSPVFPFNVLNYLYGATKVKFKDYFFASWIGMLPGTAMYVYFGSIARNLTDLLAGKVDGGVGGKVLLVVGLVATVVVTVYVTKIAGKAIKQYVPAEDEAEGEAATA